MYGVKWRNFKLVLHVRSSRQVGPELDQRCHRERLAANQSEEEWAGLVSNLTRADVIANIGVIVAALLVAVTASRTPDLTVGLAIGLAEDFSWTASP